MEIYQVGTDICSLQMETGYIKECNKRKNHDEASITDLLTVPCYADLLEEEAHTSGKEEGLLEHQSALIKTHKGGGRK